MLVYSFHYLTILLKHNKRLEYIQVIYCQALLSNPLGPTPTTGSFILKS